MPASNSYLQALEAESIHILREAAAEFRKPVMLYSIGKDSSVLLHLALKAFYPAKPPFPLLHVDTTWKFREMIAFRDATAQRARARAASCTSTSEGVARGINPFAHGSAVHTDVMKTEALKQALDRHGFDAAIGGARRDEEKSRAKERMFSFRSAGTSLGPAAASARNCGGCTTAALAPARACGCFRCRTGPSSMCGQYIRPKNIPVVPLYFAAERPVVERDGMLIMVDDERLPLRPARCRRCAACGSARSAAIRSPAPSSPRPPRLPRSSPSCAQRARPSGRAALIDHDQSGSMERKKREGYF